jgi:hypothetical protein
VRIVIYPLLEKMGHMYVAAWLWGLTQSQLERFTQECIHIGDYKTHSRHKHEA